MSKKKPNSTRYEYVKPERKRTEPPEFPSFAERSAAARDADSIPAVLPAFDPEAEKKRAHSDVPNVKAVQGLDEEEELSLFTGSMAAVSKETMHAAEEAIRESKTAEIKLPDLPPLPTETKAAPKEVPAVAPVQEAPKQTLMKAEVRVPKPEPKPAAKKPVKQEATVPAAPAKESRPVETKPAETKPVEVKKAEVKPAEPKPVPKQDLKPLPKEEAKKAVKTPLQSVASPKAAKKTTRVPLPKNKKPKGHHSGTVLVTIFFVMLIMGFAGGFGGFMWFEKLIKDVPALDVGKREEYSQASKVFDHTGNFIAEYGTNENVEWANKEDMPQALRDAFISIEDERFYSHNGIDLKRLVGAVIGQLTGNASYGASTITQQLIKNTHLTQEVSYKRKAMEIHLALELEKVMSKDDILTWYMNTLYLGDSNYGVKVAAKDYFGKDLQSLSLRECAILAGLAQSPNQYNPRLSKLKGDMTATNKRANDVLYTMYTHGKITESQYEAALNEHLNVLENSRRYKMYDYPIYVEYAVENVATKLLEAEEAEITDESLTEKKQWLRTAGYIIYTAFDKNIQDITQDAITNFDRYPALVTGSQVEASTVIMDQHTGEVVAMVGGREEPKEPEGFNRATDSTQAVGSSIKPLSVYAPACETGDYPGTTVMDTQESIQGYGADNSYPNGDHTGGAITMRKALELSHNIPAARFLLEHVGIDRAYDFMVEEGFAPENLAKTPAGLALGATDVTTLEMTAAYACLANGGEYIEPHAYKRVTDRFGNEILNGNDVERHRVFSKSTAWLVTDMMHSNMVEGYGVNARLTNVTSAGKTGTHEHQVISFGGYSPYYTSFVRISADDYVRMINSSSYYQSAGLWHAYMEPIHEGLEDKEILDYTAEDVGIEKYWVCTNSGQLAQDWCEGHWEYAAPNNAPTVYCEGHQYGSGDEEWNEWNQESNIDYNDPEWYLKGWWDEAGNFHPY